MNLLYLVAFILALSGWGLYPYLKLFKPDRPPLERFLIMQAIGFTITWLIIFLLLSLKILHPAAIHLWVLAGAMIYLVKWRKGACTGSWWDDFFTGLESRNQLHLARMLASISILAYFVFLYFANAPTTTWDPLDYHYVMPRVWLINGSFVNLPRIMYSNFPAATELIWLAGMALRSEIVANLFTWWFGVLFGLTLLAISQRYFTVLAGWIGLVIFLALPIVYTEEMPGGVIDLAVFTFNLLTIYFAVKFVENLDREDFWMTVLCASNGLAMKHSSLITLVFAVIIVLYISKKQNQVSKGLKNSIVLFALAFVLPLLWYVKSFIYTGNPVYPFLEGLFHPDSDLSIDILYWSNPNFTRDIFDWLTYWYHVVSDVGMVQFRFRLINGIYLGMLPFIIYSIRKPGYHRSLIAYALFIIVLLLYQAPGEPRYQLAAWAVLGVALGLGLYESHIMRDRTMRVMIPLALVLPVAVTLTMCVHENRNKHAFIWGSESHRSYYMKTVGVYPLIDHMNNRTPEESLVIWCDPRVYLFKREHIPAYPFDTGTLPSWRNETFEIVKDWKEMGVTHLGFTMPANYRAWVVGVILEQAELDDVDSGYVYVEDNFSPGIRYEVGKLDFSFHPMSRKVERLGPLTSRALQLASYATHGIDYTEKNNTKSYKIDLSELIDNRKDDIDVVMIRKLLEIGNMGFLSPVAIAESEGILFEINYAPLEWLDVQSDGGDN